MGEFELFAARLTDSRDQNVKTRFWHLTFPDPTHEINLKMLSMDQEHLDKTPPDPSRYNA